MIVKMYFKGVEYDLSDYVDISDNHIHDTIQGFQDSARIVLSGIKANVFSGLDTTKRLPTFCLVYINNQKGIERHYYTASTFCTPVVKNRLYRHELNLIELSKILQLKTIRDMTVTQPQDGNYFASSTARSVMTMSNAKDKIYKNLYPNHSVPDDNPLNWAENYGLNYAMELYNAGQKYPLTFSKVSENNASIISGNRIIEPGTYIIDFDISVINPYVFFNNERRYNTLDMDWGKISSNGGNQMFFVEMTADTTQEIIRQEVTTTQTSTSIIMHTSFPQISIYTNLYEKKYRHSVELIITQPTDIDFNVSFQGFDNNKWYIKEQFKRFLQNETVRYAEHEMRGYVSGANLTITKKPDDVFEEDDLPIRLGEVVQKILRLSELDIVISENTLSMLNKYGAPESSYTKFTVWDALQEICGIIGALPEIIINNNNQKELIFYSYSDMENDYVIIDPINVQTETSSRDIENYVASLQLNADNIVSGDLVAYNLYNNTYEDNLSNVDIKTNWITLRSNSDGNVKITTDNAGIKLSNRIYQIRQVEIKGLDLDTLTGGILPYNSEYIWKLNEEDDYLRIVEEKYWMTLDDTNNYSNIIERTAIRKNNVIYYKQGDNRLYGLTFTAQFKPVVESDTEKSEGNRTLYEMIFAKAIIKSGITQAQLDTILNKLKDAGKVAEDNKMKFRIEYIPYEVSRASIYKEDISGFELPYIEKYYNETAILNDPKSLGSNTQENINRLGNTIISYSGYIKNGEIPMFIGSKTSDNKILTSITLNNKKSRTEYVANYVKDFTLIDDYVGVKSPHRQYEIPINDIVLALDKSRTHIFLDNKPISSTNSVWSTNIKNFFDFKNNISKAPLFAEVSTYHFESDYINNINNEKYIRPIAITPTGKTISFKYQMESNYSAGAIKKKIRHDNIDIFMQEDKLYTTKFGRLYGSKVRLVKDVDKDYIVSNPIIEDMYPVLPDGIVTEVYTENKYIVDKDAREIMALSEEVSFHSEDNDSIIIYDGITRFNPIALNDFNKNDIKIAILNDDYKVSKSAKKVKYENLQSINGNLVNNITYQLFDDRIEFIIPQEANGKGLVIYNDYNNSGDLVLIYLTEINGLDTKTIYFGTKKLGE